MWDETMNKIAKRPYMITPFNNGIKKYYYETTNNQYNDNQ